MSELNKYNLYNLGFQNQISVQKDEVDRMIDEMVNLHVYQEVKDFILNNFGEVDGTKYFDYPELNKQIGVINSPQKIVVCCFKNAKQYYGKGWQAIDKDNL